MTANNRHPRSRSSQRTVAAAALVLAAALTGCGHGQSRESVEAEPLETGVTFSPSKGLLVPPQTAKFIGLQVADVEERTITAAFQFSARVYHTTDEAQFASLRPRGTPAALASGNVSPLDAAKLREGQSVSVQSTDDEIPRAGYIIAVKRDLAHTTGQVEVLLGIPDANTSLALAAFVSVSVPASGEKGAVSVPRSALFRTTEGDFVYTVSGDRFVRTLVKPRVTNHEMAEIADGLYAGDQVVVQPVMTLWLAELQFLRGGKACADGQ